MTMSKLSLLKTEENEIEFYTVEATGESGISQSGLAKLCGVSQPMIFKLEKTLITFEGSNWLKSFVDEALTLITSEDAALIDGQEVGNLRIYRAKFCVSVMKHYADKGRKQALFSLMKFAEMGFNRWVQQITGWEPPSDVDEIKAGMAEMKAALQQIAAAQTVLPGGELKPEPLPLYTSAELSKQNRREMRWATVPHNQVYRNCESVKQVLRWDERQGGGRKYWTAYDIERRCEELGNGD